MRPLTRLMDLSNRKALVIGGAGHIGRTVCETLVEMGATVCVMDQDEKVCAKTAQSIGKRRKKSVIGLACNLLEEESTRTAVRQAINKLRGLDIVVHCAAYVGTSNMPGWAVPYDRQSVSAWDKAMRVNLTSIFVLAQETSTALARVGRGSMILFSSIYGMAGPDFNLYKGTNMSNPAAYNASKGGLLQLMRYLATCFAPKIRVNAISPGGVWRGQAKSFHQRYVSRTPLGRMAIEEDFKGAVAYLASDMSSYVTGQNLVVDGGWTVW